MSIDPASYSRIIFKVTRNRYKFNEWINYSPMGYNPHVYMVQIKNNRIVDIMTYGLHTNAGLYWSFSGYNTPYQSLLQAYQDDWYFLSWEGWSKALLEQIAQNVGILRDYRISYV